MTSRMPTSTRIRVVICAVIVVVLAFGVVSFFVDKAILDQTYARVYRSQPNLLATYDDYDETYAREPVSFELDGYTLRGYVYGPENTRGLVIFRHGIFSQHEDYLPLIVGIVDEGWKVFAYDAIGCGVSDGDSVLGFAQSPLDVAAAVEYARESGMADGMKIALWGHSWGGYGVAAALDRVDVDACITMSGFDEPIGIINSSAQQAFGPFAYTQFPTLWLNNYLAFGSDANRRASRAILDSGTPTLIIHGSNDQVVPYDDVSVMSNTLSAWTFPRNVAAATRAEPGRSGHNDYFYSRESQRYLNECAEQLQVLLDENGDDPTSPEVVAFVESVDKLKANTADPGLIDEVNSFLSVRLESAS